MTTTIWAYHHSPARGWQWVKQRTCDLAQSGDWLTVFRTDEPNVTFCASVKRPTKAPQFAGERV